MATQSAVFTFALPEDENANRLVIKSSATKDGTYSTDTTVTYEYGTTTYEYDSLDDTKWYKIQFTNSSDSETGPDSDPVFGGDFSKASPFLAVSTSSDGANYASIQDVYDYSTLTTADVSTTRVSQALRRARAVIDLRTAALDLDRFTKTFKTSTSRKKYNATLRIVKEAEINIALGNIYRGMSDDLLLKDMRDVLKETDGGFDSVSIGSTSVSASSGASNNVPINQLRALANRYLAIGAALIASIQPPDVRIHWEPDEISRSPKFKYPFNGF